MIMRGLVGVVLGDKGGGCCGCGEFGWDLILELKRG